MVKLFFSFIILGNISFGQTATNKTTAVAKNFVSDTINNYPNISFNKKVKLFQIDKSPAKIDIRLCKIHSLSNTITLRRIFLVGKVWNAIEYEESNNPVKINKYRLKAQPSFDSLLLQLLSYNIITLPDQKDLKDKMKKVVGVDEDGNEISKVINVMDGDSYTVEMRMNNNYRVYHFDNPESYAKFYNNVSELKDYLSIVEAFNKYLNRVDDSK